MYRAVAGDAHAAGGVLFSVVRIGGSSYRQPGAHMLVLTDSKTAGTLSGGCLEADLLRRAAWTVRSGAVVERFSTAFDDTAEIPYGLGCGGEIDVLAEPLDTPEAKALLEAMDATLRQEERTVATLLPDPRAGSLGIPVPLCRIVLDAAGDVLFASEALATEDVVQLRFSARAASRKESCSWTDTPLGAVFTERLLPAQRLVIFGAGEDARPLVRLALEMGWLPVVVDTRSHRAGADRFPSAECVQSDSAAGLPVLQEDAVVLMTHSYQQDRQLLSELLQVRPKYLGLLGARHRSALLLHEASLLAEVSLSHAVEATHAPIGLELGGEGPEAIALAVVAEVQHVLSRRQLTEAVSSRRLHLAQVQQLLTDSPGSAIYDLCALSGEPDSVPGSQAAPQ